MLRTTLRWLFGACLLASGLALAIFWLSGADLFGSAVSSVVVEVHAQEECEDGGPDTPGCEYFYIYYPGICGYLNPDSGWYKHFNCEDREANLLMTVESLTRRVVHVVDFGDFLYIQVEIDLPDGSVRHVSRLLERGQQRVRVIKERK